MAVGDEPVLDGEPAGAVGHFERGLQPLAWRKVGEHPVDVGREVGAEAAGRGRGTNESRGREPIK